MRVQASAETSERNLSLSEEEKSSWECKGNIRQPNRPSGNVHGNVFLSAGTSCPVYLVEQLGISESYPDYSSQGIGAYQD